MKQFLILTNAIKDNELLYTVMLKEYIESKGGIVKTAKSENDYENGMVKKELIEGAECVIVMGGDGTMLRAAHTTFGYDIPLIGVNLGTLGFLTEIDLNQMTDMADRLLSDDYTVEERMMLYGDTGRGGNYALNDIVVCRSGILRVLSLKIYVNGREFDTYEADGVIISTPTGSTGYNLSAGGPLVSPNTRLIVLTPISPHSLSKKSIVFDSRDTIKIELVSKRKSQIDEAVVAFDGYDNYQLSKSDSVVVSASDKTVKLIKMTDTNFYEVLRKKVI